MHFFIFFIRYNLFSFFAFNPTKIIENGTRRILIVLYEHQEKTLFNRYLQPASQLQSIQISSP
jgi:hypothetical protein